MSKKTNRELINSKQILVYKPLGKTPFECIKMLKAKYPSLKSLTAGYAGRLDPMAEGLLLLLIGEENKKRKAYEKLTKTYDVDVLLGISTDTYDLLGIITKTITRFPSNLEIRIHQIIPTFCGTHEQPYPPYSSVRIMGKPLFYWARSKKLNEISIPSRNVTISSITTNKVCTMLKTDLQIRVQKCITRVSGDFRQNEILHNWQIFFQKTQLLSFPIIRITVTCSHGTYMRSLAHAIGKKLQTEGLALSITRTRIGPYTINNAIYL